MSRGQPFISLTNYQISYLSIFLVIKIVVIQLQIAYMIVAVIQRVICKVTYNWSYQINVVESKYKAQNCTKVQHLSKCTSITTVFHTLDSFGTKSLFSHHDFVVCSESVVVYGLFLHSSLAPFLCNYLLSRPGANESWSPDVVLAFNEWSLYWFLWYP